MYIFFMNVPSSYARMYKDVRAAVDLCHRDGTLKQMVAKDPKRYEYEITNLSKWEMDKKFCSGNEISDSQGNNPFFEKSCVLKLLILSMDSWWNYFDLVTLLLKFYLRYINEDASIVPMLEMLRDSGRATFLVTNR